MTLDLDAIKARAQAASPGPWEDGEVWGTAGVNARMFGAGRCTYCNLGEPAWTGRTDINGTVMDAHRHRLPDPYALGWRITTTDGIVADDIARPEDQVFIRHAIDDVPALIAEVERLRGELEQSTRGLVRLMNALDAVEHLTKDTDGGDVDADADIPVGEIRRVLAEAVGR